MALVLNKELFVKQNELEDLKELKTVREREVVELTAKIGVKEREVVGMIQRVKQDMTNRVARINASCFRDDPFKYRARLSEDMSISIEKDQGQNVFASVWVLCQTESGDFGVDPEQNNLPGNPAEQLHLFGKFAGIIGNLK
jgi:hypothetical protein